MKTKRTEMIGCLEKILPAITGKEVVRQSDCVAFSDGYAWSYNDEWSLSQPLPEGLDLNGAVRAAELLGLLKRIKFAEVNLETDQNSLTITWGKKSRATIRMEEILLPLEEITEPGKEDWSPLPDGFCEAVQFVAFCAGSDMAKPLLTYLHVSGDSVEACDFFRICRRSMGGEIDQDLLIPAVAAGVLIKYRPVDWYADPDQNWIYFVNEDDTLFCCRTIGDDYPDLDRLLVEDGEELEIPEEILDALDRVGVFAKRDLAQDEEVKFSVADGQLTITAGNDVGEITEGLDVKDSGRDLDFCTSPVFLRKAFKLIRRVRVGDAALQFDGDGWLHVVSLYEEV
jgi:DNA polymerase III sliding clamp (beta) subunit (PCNA family)